MSDQRSGRDDAAMSDILASIRRIVTEEERGGQRPGPAEPGEALLLTEAMRIDRPPLQPRPQTPPQPMSQPAPQAAAEPRPGPAAPPLAAEPEGAPPAAGGSPEPTVEAPALSIDEAQVADIARAVLHEELKGDFGKTLTRNLRLLVREEIARALAERPGGPS